jgi:hypothetical protein
MSMSMTDIIYNGNKQFINHNTQLHSHILKQYYEFVGGGLLS